MSTITTSPDPVRTPAPVAGLFSVDVDDPLAIFEAEGFGAPWNGWATPVVTRETLAEFIGRLEGHTLEWTVDVARITYDEDVDGPFDIHPDANGLYPMAEGGWCLDRVDEEVVGALRAVAEHVTCLEREEGIAVVRRASSVVLLDAERTDRALALGPLHAVAARAETVVGWQVVTSDARGQRTEQIAATDVQRLWDVLDDWQHPATPAAPLEAAPALAEHAQGPGL
ncbi:hypothetical protein ACTVBU_10855 [Sanguibacter sp. A246]|uniref:hypothetical protein n=1 Tax=Sanguibacter sp. A246 TaxID=3457326 RepID=UPI003FD838D9